MELHMPAIAQLADTFLAGVQTLRQAVKGMNQEQLVARPVAGKWSTLEVVCHLVDSDQAWIHRMKRIVAEDRPLLIGYDETRFSKSLNYHGRDIEEELALFELSRRNMARVLRQLPDEALARTGIHSESGLLTLQKAIELEIEHVPHHVRFIEEKRRAFGEK
jgi:uncharacterized damage-inducible protein DinB